MHASMGCKEAISEFDRLYNNMGKQLKRHITEHVSLIDDK